MRKVLFILAFFCAYSVFASVSLNFKGEKLSKAIMSIAKAGNINVILPYNKNEPKVSLNLIKVNPIIALKSICKTFKLKVTKLSNIYIISFPSRRPMPAMPWLSKNNYNKEQSYRIRREKMEKMRKEMMLKKNNIIKQKLKKAHEFYENNSCKNIKNPPIHILSANKDKKYMTLSVGNRKVNLREGSSYQNRIKLLKVVENNRVLVFYPELMIRKIEKIK